uniref:adenylate kinase isoenzyme 1-like isoform X4 n=1 Tax=Ictidomys tridecemlineatus TaxID=43179 RepID=UPI001A9E86AE|nr:adenylate kinase isoenzyme 1-like isoform X4 [Ictidomys tridecemlineatus]
MPGTMTIGGSVDILKSSLIIFVVGGPGCGKETQCKNMATKYGFCHVGLGQLLRQEAQKSTHRGRQIRDMMLQGLLVPSGLILDMISKNMLSHPESRGFLIDGFPQELKQAKEFERIDSPYEKDTDRRTTMWEHREKTTSRSHREDPGESSPADTVTLDFQPPELWEPQVLLSVSLDPPCYFVKTALETEEGSRSYCCKTPIWSHLLLS